MRAKESPVYLLVYAMPYDTLQSKSCDELQQMLRQVEVEARQAVRVYNWLEGILRLKACAGEAE